MVNGNDLLLKHSSCRNQLSSDAVHHGQYSGIPTTALAADRVNAVTENGFDDVVTDGDATAANEGSPEPMERPVPEYGNRDEQRHEEEQLAERQRHCVDSAYTGFGLS